MASVLVICVGNPLRGDDGVAHSVAAALAPREGLDVVRAPQLDIALAEDVARAALVVVVDAERRDAPAVAMTAIGDDAGSGTSARAAHATSPEALLALARVLFGGRAEGLLVTVAAPEMGHSDALSPTARAAAGEAAALVDRIVSDTL